jgi:lipoprotein-releasing system ATP-binding protein
MLKAINLSKAYGNLSVLREISIELHACTSVALVGSSGAGKTTLLNILGTLDRPDSGQLYLDGINLIEARDRQLAMLRNRNIGFVFQFHNLLAEFTALENVLMPAWIGGVERVKANTRAKELLIRLGLSHRMQHRPGQLSGGEQQRVAVARALVNQPKLVLADEPTGNLDSDNAEAVVQMLLEASRDAGAACLWVTHNRELARMADYMLYMRDGQIFSHDLP